MCIEHEREDLRKVEKLIWNKIPVIDDTSYLEEVVSKSKILGYKNFEENGKEKYKHKTRKWIKADKKEKAYWKTGRLQAKKKRTKK